MAGLGDVGGGRRRSRARSNTCHGEEDIFAELPRGLGGPGSDQDDNRSGSQISVRTDSFGSGSASSGSGSATGGGRGGGVRGTPVSSQTRNILTLQDFSPPRSRRKHQGLEDDDERELMQEEEEEARRRQQAGGRGRTARVTKTVRGKAAAPHADQKVKLLLLGDGGVGKTSLLMRYSEDKFMPGLLATAGVAYQSEYLQIGEEMVRCDIWDTAGQERFHVITQSYYSGSHGIILVYDAADPEELSFNNVRYWMDNIRKHASSSCVKVLLGNKVDCKDKQISRERGQALADEFGITFFETSAKDGTNVTEAFHAIAAEAVRNLQDREKGDAGSVPKVKHVRTNQRDGKCRIM